MPGGLEAWRLEAWILQPRRLIGLLACWLPGRLGLAWIYWCMGGSGGDGGFGWLWFVDGGVNGRVLTRLTLREVGGL